MIWNLYFIYRKFSTISSTTSKFWSGMVSMNIDIRLWNWGEQIFYHSEFWVQLWVWRAQQCKAFHEFPRDYRQIIERKIHSTDFIMCSPMFSESWKMKFVIHLMNFIMWRTLSVSPHRTTARNFVDPCPCSWNFKIISIPIVCESFGQFRQSTVRIKVDTWLLPLSVFSNYIDILMAIERHRLCTLYFDGNRKASFVHVFVWHLFMLTQPSPRFRNACFSCSSLF